MAAACAFQALPPPIIDLTLRYLLELPTEIPSFSLFTIPNSNDEVKPLYHTCRAWRATALALMFARCKIVLSDSIEFTFNLNETNPRITTCLGSHLTEYVKTIAMTIDYASIANGSVLSRLENTYYMLNFANALSLMTDIHIADTSFTGGLELSGIAERTIQRIKDMMPSLNNIQIRAHDDAPNRDCAQYRQLHTLVRGLTRIPLSSHLWLGHPCKQYIIEDCAAVCNLTALTCVWDANCASLARIMHTNADSLLELRIVFASFTRLEQLVIDVRGNPVIYTHLATLVFSEKGADPMAYLPVLEMITPFPRLKVFRSLTKYPFGDDTVFRGNNSSLEDLYLMADYKIIKMLSGHGVFARGRLKSLRKLMVADCIVEIDNVDAVIDTYMVIIGNVLPGLQQLRAIDADISDALIATLTGKVQYENLQLLSLYCTFLTLTDIVRLLKSLPNLRILANRISGLGTDFRKANALGIAGVLRTQYNPLNRSFKRWHITNTAHFPENFVIASILLIADVCPCLESILLNSQTADAAMQTFKKLVGSKLYADCKDRFTVLLSHASKRPTIHIKRVYRPSGATAT